MGGEARKNTWTHFKGATGSWASDQWTLAFPLTILMPVLVTFELLGRDQRTKVMSSRTALMIYGTTKVRWGGETGCEIV